MSQLRIFLETDPTTPLSVQREHPGITAALGEVGVNFGRWPGEAPPSGATQEEILDAYRVDIERLVREKGYQAVDVIRILPDHPDRVALRHKFLAEHTHDEDEVRFFVAGSGLFALHIEHKVYEVTCGQADLIGVPAGTRHWFDMGPQPFFIAIRLFSNPAGWVANLTGADVAQRFPRFEPVQVD